MQLQRWVKNTVKTVKYAYKIDQYKIINYYRRIVSAEIVSNRLGI